MNEREEIIELFNELSKTRVKWMERTDVPTLSEFIQESLPLINKNNNELVVWFVGNYSIDNINYALGFCRLPLDGDYTEKEKFNYCEGQYPWQIQGLQVARDLRDANSKKITWDEFFNNHPCIDRPKE